MPTSTRPIVIASRRSALARAQTQMVGAALAQAHPDVGVAYLWLESEGDRHAAAPLADSGGKGLFAQAIETALLQGRADIAVHSLKDLPAVDTTGLTIAAVPTRHDVRDCLIVPPDSEARTLVELPHGATVGTASPRRAAQIRLLRPDLQTALLRGNIETRLRKVMTDRVADATLLAVAGLHRGGLAEHATRILEPEVMLPAACQGALAVQCRADDQPTLARCAVLNDATSAVAVGMERAIVAGLEGDCRSPIAVLAQPKQRDGVDGFQLRVRALHPRGVMSIDAELWGRMDEADQLPARVLSDLLSRGAAEMIRAE